MKIESLAVKKNSTDCVLTFDDNSNYTVSMDLVLKFQLKKGYEISDSEFKIISVEQDLINAKQDAYNYVAYKPRTQKQVFDKLREKKYTDEFIEAAIKHLQKFDLLDDKKYAFNFANEYAKRKKAGRIKVYNELRNRGISSDLADEAVENCFGKIDEYEFAESAAEKKLNLLKGKPKDKIYRSLRDYLLRQGYNSEIVREIVKKMVE